MMPAGRHTENQSTKSEMFTSIAEFLCAVDHAVPVPKEFLPLPELGKDAGVWVRGMTAAEWDEFQQSRLDRKTGKSDMANYRAGIVAFCLADDHGQRLSKDPIADAVEIGRRFGPFVRRIYAVADRLMNFDVETDPETEEEGDTVKN
jgi:hypothetical protein